MGNGAAAKVEQVRNSNSFLWILVVLRVVIGWHFLYEGIVKLLEPNWTSGAYLAESRWIFAPIFHWIAQTPAALTAVDFLNVWGLTLIGLALILGVFSRAAAISGAVLLGLYYVANPPLVGLVGGMPTEGNYVLIDKNLVELVALLALAAIPTGEFIGLDRMIAIFRSRKPAPTLEADLAEEAADPAPSETLSPLSLQRRDLIRSLATVPVLGGFSYEVLKQRGWQSYEERHLLAAQGDVDAVSTATLKTFNFSSLKDLKGQIPTGQIGDMKLSRMFLGGNLVGGWAHARDLIYASDLVKAYHTDERVFQTFQLAEQCGMNTFLTNPQLCRVINKYWRTQGGKIQFISDCAYGEDIIQGIDMSIDGGAHSCYVQGGVADRFVEQGDVDKIGEAVEYIRQNGQLAGIGAHALKTVQECVRVGIKPDYWVKTLHHCNYWSANPDDQHDNIWCTDPEDVIAFMGELEEPWIAFKTLAAGAIHPDIGFKYAFENGADFICVGMYDFQVVEDANIALDVLAGDLNRTRPWRG